MIAARKSATRSVTTSELSSRRKLTHLSGGPVKLVFTELATGRTMAQNVGNCIRFQMTKFTDSVFMWEVLISSREN